MQEKTIMPQIKSLLENVEIRALLEAKSMVDVMAIGSLTAVQVDNYLQSTKVIHCLVTSYSDGRPRWVAPLELDALWEKEIKPRMAMAWDGFYDAWECRTDQHELIIVFVFGYVPI